MDDVAGLIRELVTLGYSTDDAEAWLGPNSAIMDQVDIFRRSPDERLMMIVARRGKMPFSEAEHRWQNDLDRIREVAWDVLQAEEAAARCPECGIDHDEVRDPATGKPLEGSRYKLGLIDCWVSTERDRASKQRISEEDREAGVRFGLMARQVGDPWIDDRGDLNED